MEKIYNNEFELLMKLIDIKKASEAKMISDQNMRNETYEQVIGKFLGGKLSIKIEFDSYEREAIE